MNNFDFLMKNEKLNTILDSVNILNKDELYACHGRYHVMDVVDKVQIILEKLGYNDRIIDMGRTAALLHDIGAIEGKEGHPKRSSEMCIDFLNTTDFTQEEKNIIVWAIEDHSKGTDIKHPIGAALLLADKISIDKNRVLELGKKVPNYFLLTIENVRVDLVDDNIAITFFVTNQFSKDVFETEWAKGISCMKKACDYLGFHCCIMFEKGN